MSIVLVHMPYAAVERPSIGLGTLQACLKAAGLECEVVYANLLLAQRIGLKRYQLVEFTPTDVFPPAAPKNLAAVGSEGAINLIWDI